MRQQMKTHSALFTQLLIDMNVRNTFSEKMFSWKLIIQHQAE